MIPFFFFGFFDTPGDNPPTEQSLFGGVAHFKKLHERSSKAREIEALQRAQANKPQEVIEIPQEVKEIISNVAKTNKREAELQKQLKAQLKALEIQLKQEYIEALKIEAIKFYLAEQERQEEEEAIAMMMIALI